MWELKKSILTVLLLILYTTNSWAQMPQDLPNQPEPTQIDSVLKVVVFIIVPIVMIASLFIWRRKSRKKKEGIQKEQDKNGG